VALTARASASTEDDAALAAAAGTGDSGAFTTLYHRYAERVFARITHLIGPRPEREDVLQQVFLELHRSLPRFRGESSLSTFLYRITVNVAYDQLRRRGRRPVEQDDQGFDVLLDADLSPEERVRKREELRLAFTLLEQLSPAKRIAFVLVAVEGLSLADAARMIDASPDAVKQRVLQARRELVELVARAERPTGKPRSAAQGAR
jgi:RNA polymerase sigma-70 factor (ECF subfamily)